MPAQLEMLYISTYKIIMSAEPKHVVHIVLGYYAYITAYITYIYIYLYVYIYVYMYIYIYTIITISYVQLPGTRTTATYG